MVRACNISVRGLAVVAGSIAALCPCAAHNSYLYLPRALTMQAATLTFDLQKPLAISTRYGEALYFGNWQLGPTYVDRLELELNGSATDNGLFRIPGDKRSGGEMPRAFAWGGEQIERTVSVSMQRPVLGEGTLQIRAGSYDGRATSAATFDRLFSPSYEDSRDVASRYVEFKTRVFGGRLESHSQFAWSRGFHNPFLDLGAGVSSYTGFKSGGAISHSVNVRVIEGESLNLSIDGLMSSVDPAFYAPPGGRPAGFIAVPWDRSYLSVRLNAGSLRVSATAQNIASRLFERRTERATMSYSSTEISFYSKETSRLSWLNPNAILSHAPERGASVEFMPTDILYEFADSVPALLEPLLPTIVSLDHSNGDQTQLSAVPGVRKTAKLDALAIWDSPLGELTVTYWRDARRPVSSGTPGLTTSDEVIDISHSIHRGDWRFGAGFSLLRSTEDDADFHSKDNYLSGTFAINYTPDAGPSLEARLGADGSDSQFDFFSENPLVDRRRTWDLHIRADFSEPFRRLVRRPDASIAAEYRRRVENGGSPSLFAGTSECCSEAFLISAAMGL